LNQKNKRNSREITAERKERVEFVLEEINAFMMQQKGPEGNDAIQSIIDDHLIAPIL